MTSKRVLWAYCSTPDTHRAILVDVLAVCEELKIFFDGVIIFSCGLSVSSIQVNKVCASTELKTRIATLAYYICVGESFVTDTNPRASRYVIFFFDFTFYISFCFEKMTVLGGNHVRLTTILEFLIDNIFAMFGG